MTHLNTVLDPGLMRPALEKAMRTPVTSLEITQVRHKPGKSCMVAYRVNSEHLVYGRIYPHGASESRYQKACGHVLVPAVLGDAVTHVPELDLVLWSFPNDRKLPGLSKLMDPSVVHQLARVRFGRRVVSLDREIVHYSPEHGCTLRATAHLEDGVQWTVFGKSYADGTASRTWANMRALHRQIPCAEPLLLDEPAKILWQAGIPGRPLELTDSLDTWRSAGRAVSQLHRNRVPCPNLQVPLAGRLQRAGELLAMPEFVERIIAAYPGPSGQLVTLHGDLHGKNLLVTGATVSLIDLDTLAEGDPLEDLGSLVASVWTRSLQSSFSQERTQAVVSAIAEGYGNVPVERLKWFTGAALVAEQAARGVTRLKESRIAVLEQVLDLAAHMTGISR